MLGEKIKKYFKEKNVFNVYIYVLYTIRVVYNCNFIVVRLLYLPWQTVKTLLMRIPEAEED